MRMRRMRPARPGWNIKGDASKGETNASRDTKRGRDVKRSAPTTKAASAPTVAGSEGGFNPQANSCAYRPAPEGTLREIDSMMLMSAGRRRHCIVEALKRQQHRVGPVLADGVGA